MREETKKIYAKREEKRNKETFRERERGKGTKKSLGTETAQNVTREKFSGECGRSKMKITKQRKEHYFNSLGARNRKKF